MSRHHHVVMTDDERAILLRSLAVASRSLDRFERPGSDRIRWRSEWTIASRDLHATALRSRGGFLGVSVSADARRTTLSIREIDRDMRAPIVTITERIPSDRRPTAPDAEEVDALLTRWKRLAELRTERDDDARDRTIAILSALAAAGGTTRSDLPYARLPSPYGAAGLLADAGPNGAHAEAAIRALDVPPSMLDRIMDEDLTTVASCSWRNENRLKIQRRIAFDLSGSIVVTLNDPDPIEVMRVLAEGQFPTRA